MKNTIVLKSLIAAVLCLSTSAFAHEFDEDILAENNDAEIEMTEQIRTEQKEYFEELQENWMQGTWARPRAGSCKYISNIFSPPPAKTVVLTFDDGPSASLTPLVLDILKKHGVKATFFMKGNAAASKMSIVKRVRAEGHIVANHSYSHPNFHTLSQGSQVSEFTTTDSILRSEMTSPKLFRYPYGNSTCSTNALAKKQGYRIVGWHIDSCDWAFAKNGYVTAKQAALCAVKPSNTANFAGHVLSEVRRLNGGIVLMHEVHNRTVYSLDEIIVRLKREGYTFTNLNDAKMDRYLR